jgi:hypothetical protein
VCDCATAGIANSQMSNKQQAERNRKVVSVMMRML